MCCVRHPVKLANALRCQVQITRGEMIIRVLTVEQAEDYRDAAAKALYGRFFSWVVRRANEFLSPDGPGLHKLLQVGVLDIFGFEVFKTNSFEQLCINTANEQLHRYFNEHIFAHELTELKAEGVATANIEFKDNAPTLDMFLRRTGGVFSVLDEETYFPKASHARLLW